MSDPSSEECLILNLIPFSSSLCSLPRPKTTRQHHKVRELNYQFNLDSALNMKRAKSLEQVGIRSDVNFLRGDSTYDVCTEGGGSKNTQK